MSASVILLGLSEFLAGIKEAQVLKARYTRSELKRGGQRVRKEFIRRDLSGSPGIAGGPWRKGKQVFSFVTGSSNDTAAQLDVAVGINKAIRVHEEGHTFHPVRGSWIYIRKNKGGRGTGVVVARVKQVVIPKRTHFVALCKEMASGVLRKAGEAGVRGVVVAAEKHMTRFTAAT